MLKWEKNVIHKMIRLYCRQNHPRQAGQTLCDDCRGLLEYALKRLDHCKFGANKPTCEKCPVHCYKPEMREKVKTVMRYAGPRMIIAHPVDAVKHIIKNRKTKV